MKHTVAIVTHAHVLQNFCNTWVRRVACQKQRLKPKLEGGAGLGEHPKIWDLLRISATVEASNFKFRTQLGFGTRLPKNNVLDQNWLGCGPEEHPKNWDPLYIFATVEASNFKFCTQVGFGTSLPKNAVYDQNNILAGVWARGASEKIWDPLLISATVEASNFKFGTQVGFLTSLPKTTFRTKIGGGLGQGSIRKKLGSPIYF